MILQFLLLLVRVNYLFGLSGERIKQVTFFIAGVATSQTFMLTVLGTESSIL